jgi:hypothetical protein
LLKFPKNWEKKSSIEKITSLFLLRADKYLIMTLYYLI